MQTLDNTTLEVEESVVDIDDGFEVEVEPMEATTSEVRNADEGLPLNPCSAGMKVGEQHSSPAQQPTLIQKILTFVVRLRDEARMQIGKAVAMMVMLVAFTTLVANAALAERAAAKDHKAAVQAELRIKREEAKTARLEAKLRYKAELAKIKAAMA